MTTDTPINKPRKKVRECPSRNIDEYMKDIDLKKLMLVESRGKHVNYRIGECLGSGGFAKVYKAGEYASSDTAMTNIKRIVALKIVPKKRVERAEQAQRIRKEIEIQKSLSHPNIVELYNSFEDGQKFVMMLEYCEERTLLQFMRNFKRRMVPELQVVEIMNQVLSAIRFLHNQDIIHRDIKLSNILKTGDVVKLADFGLAIKYKETESRAICGTPNFLSPEVYEEKFHSPASDIWATGCVLYSLLVGQNPFTYDGMERTQAKICAMKFDIPDFLSDKAKDAIKKILERDFQKRPTADEVRRMDFFRLKIDHKVPSVESPPIRTGRSHSSPQQCTNTPKHKVRRSLYFQAKKVHASPRASPRTPKRYVTRPALHKLDANVVNSPRSARPKLVKRRSNRSLLPQLDSQHEREVALEEAGHERKRLNEHVSSREPALKHVKLFLEGNFVTKWVDYSNQIGLGYVLSDGTTNVLLRNGETVKGRKIDGITHVKLIRANDVVDINNSEQRHDRNRLKYWTQFEKYMQTSMIAGIEIEEDSLPKDIDTRIVIRKFHRDERALVVLLTDNVQQIHFLSGDSKGVKIVFSEFGIMIVRNRKCRYYLWTDDEIVQDKDMRDLFIYARARFEQCEKLSGPQETRRVKKSHLSKFLTRLNYC